ncbi:hypothetical protein B0H17DRAFT_1208506 [Mycena rosella]|uniref:DUF6699 domain-containing protein n=1 Tax=Mycena rosella TaxID=1033263 RepID=A0AAD7G6S1_MYCRO|nr:hypothetical protein B0H17DRAFT_1208506 [Mycena rosella]
MLVAITSNCSFGFNTPDQSRTVRNERTSGGTFSRPAEISEPAVHPPLTSLRILHPRIPFWPVDLALPADVAAAGPPFISLGDMLEALSGEAGRSGVPPAHLRDQKVVERNQGVKRVDFLRRKIVFKGLVQEPDDPEGCVQDGAPTLF